MANTGNTQQQINYGSAANDGQGDPLRTAFIKTDDNFDNIWLAGPVGSNITIVNNTVLSNNTNGNIVLRPNGVGVIQANAAIVPNATNLRDLGTADQRFRAAYIGTGGLAVDGNVTVTGNLTAGNISYTGNVFVGDLKGSVYADDSTIMVDAVDNAVFADSATFGTASVTGNISANYFVGNGSLLTGITSSYGNANVANYLASDFGTFGSNAVVTAGNVVASVVDTGAIVNEFPVGIQGGEYVWQFADDILRGPQGDTWQSSADTMFLESPANGYIHLHSLLNGNLVSDVEIEHSFVAINLANGSNVRFQFNADGTAEFPNYTFPAPDGAAGEVLKTYGNGTVYWATDSSDYGNANVAEYLTTYNGNISANNVNAGNVFTANDVFATTASFSGDSRGQNSIYAGVPLFTVLGSDVVAQFSGNVNSYTQFNFQNGNSGTLASGDYVITADNGTDETYFFNMGLGSSTHDDPDFFGDTSSPNDGYLYVVGADATGPGDTGPGNLIIGSTNGVIKFFVGNTAQANVVQTISTAGVTMTGNIIPSANATYSLGNATNYWSNLWVANNTIYIGGVPLGVTGNTLTVNGEAVLSNDSDSSITTTGNITAGNMRATSYRNASGDSILGDFVFANNTLQTDNGDGGITLSIFGPDQADPPALIEKAWLFGNTGAFYSPGNVEAPKFVGNGLFNGTTSIEIPTANSNIYVGFGLVGSIEFNAEGVTALNLAATGNITGATANISGNITGANLITTGNVVGNVSGFAIGYRDIPQVSFTGNATIAITDAGKHFYSTEGTDYVLTIADNSAVSWPVGTAITVVNRGTGNITVAQAAGVSLYLAGNSSAGNRTVTTYGMATVLNVAANVWMINGTGVS